MLCGEWTNNLTTWWNHDRVLNNPVTKELDGERVDQIESWEVANWHFLIG
jgi:hypothetical protein